MMRRFIVVGIAVSAVVLLVVAGMVASRAYLEQRAELASPSPTPVPEEVRDQVLEQYFTAVAEWPYPLPPEDALPAKPPVAYAAHGGEVAGFISIFYRCAWEAAYVSGTGESHDRALDMLALWEQLPPGISFADNSDGGYQADVLGRARAGDDSVIETIFENSCSEYRTTRVDPPDGIEIDAPIPLPPPADADSCVDVPADVPCDPAFGPDRVTDTGPVEFAMGETVLDSRGTPIAYLVAPGDIWSVVADRFLMGAQLWSLNCYHFEFPQLYVGDVVNLSAYRVAAVGVNNGSSEPAPHGDSCLLQTVIPPQI